MKKIVALLLALVMTLSLGTVAFAEGESTQPPANQAVVSIANVASRLLYYPAQYVVPAITKVAPLVVDKVDEVCNEINNSAMVQTLTVVESTVSTALGVIGTVNGMIGAAKSVLVWFPWLSSLSESLNTLEDMLMEIEQKTGIKDVDDNLAALLNWIQPTALETDGDRTYAGDAVLNYFDAAAEFLSDADNFTLGVGNSPVANFLYEMMVHYFAAK